MAKLNKLWYDRNTLFRAGIVWVIVFLLIRIVFWYVTQNVGVDSMSTANTMNLIRLLFAYLQLAAGVMAILGLFGELGQKGKRKDDGAVKMADGIWMIKK